MALRSHTITAILNNRNAPEYDGSQDVHQWLRAIEELCKIYGIPPVQMAEMAIKCTAGEANSILTPMLEAKVAEVGVWLWVDFKECVIQIEDRFRQNMRDAPRNTKDRGFCSQHPYVVVALAITMVGFGAFVVLSGVILGVLGVVGFGAFLALLGAIAGILGTAGFGTFIALPGAIVGILGTVGFGTFLALPGAIVGILGSVGSGALLALPGTIVGISGTVGFCTFLALPGAIVGILGTFGFGAFLALLGAIVGILGTVGSVGFSAFLTLLGAIVGILGTIGFGVFVALSGVTAGILGAVGSGPGGVAARSIAAGLQLVLYGGVTGRLFSVFQSLGAMVAPSLFAMFAGFRTATAGAWLGFTGRTREDPPAAES